MDVNSDGGAAAWVGLDDTMPAPGDLDALTASLVRCRDGVAATLCGLHELTDRATSLSGDLLGHWSMMATVGAFDLTVARVLEPHLDALSILDEADPPWRADADGATWGVYAAEGGTGRLTATNSAGGWSLSGVKPWCSLARHLERALVTAWTGPSTRRLFAVDLADPAISVGDEPWVARGLSSVDSPSLTFTGAGAVPVGPEEWYLERTGFARGGIRVAAVWFGAAVAHGRALRAAAMRRELDQVGLMHVGVVDAALHQTRCVLADAARDVDCHPGRAAVVAAHARRATRRCVEDVLLHVGHAMGPTPLVRDDVFAARVADVTVYIRQEHAEREEARLGSEVVEGRGLVL